MLAWVSRQIARLSVLIATVSFAVLLSALSIQFFAREVFSLGIIWADEVARLAFVWCALFGASAAWCDDALHRIDLLSRTARGWVARLIWLVCLALIAAVLIYLIYYGWRMSLRAWPQTTSTLQISAGWSYIPLPLTAALMLWVCLARLLQPMPTEGEVNP